MNFNKRDTPKIIVIGGGATGCGVARDLVLRGYKTILIELNDLGSGTTSRSHGMLQSGARYVVSDNNYAAECYRERKIISEIFPEAVELTGGFFIGLPHDPVDYIEKFSKCCEIAKIPAEEVSIKYILEKEKELTKDLIKAFKVPDAIINPKKLINLLAKDIRAHGGTILTKHQVISIKQINNSVNSVEVVHNGAKKTIECDGIVNASGPWSNRITKLINQNIELQLTKGSFLIFPQRIVNKAINRCRYPANNDIMCPSGSLSLWGTTSEIVKDPDAIKTRPEEIKELFIGAEKLFPNIRNYKSFKLLSGVRPLVKPKNIKEGMPLSRSHSVIDHQNSGIKNILTIYGGSLTTHRSMAEDVVNKLGNKFAVNVPCYSSSTPLL